MRLLFALFALSLALSQGSLSMAGDIDWSKVDDALAEIAGHFYMRCAHSD